MKTLTLFLGLGIGEILYLLLFVGFFILIVLALRAFFLWYWKVNIIIGNQERQITLLSKLLEGRVPTQGDTHYYGDPEEAARKARMYDEGTKSSDR